MKKMYFAMLLTLMMLLTACGSKAADNPVSGYQNYTLKELDPEELAPEEKTSPPSAESTINPDWSPVGNYTYVLSTGSSTGYMSALIRVNSADFKSGTAGVSYVLVKNEQDSNPVNSNGIITCPMTCRDSGDGYREITVTISDSMSLEFSGTATSQTAYFINNGIRYRLKSES